MQNPKWNIDHHKTVEETIRGQYNLDFLDFNFAPYNEILDINIYIDSVDGRHLNVNFAQKLH